MNQTCPLNEKLSDISFFIELFPVLLYLIFRKRIDDKVIRVILLLVIVGFLVDLFTIYQVANRRNSSIGSNLFTLVETLFLGYFFREILLSPVAKKIVVFLLITFSVFWVLSFLKTGLNSYLEICVNIESIIILGLSVCYFYEQIKKPDSPFIYVHPRFWIVLGYLLYAAGTFFLFLYLESLNREQQKNFFVLNSIFLIIKTIFLSVAMLMKNQPEKKKFQLH